MFRKIKINESIIKYIIKSIKDEANNLFKSGNYQLSIELYSKAIKQADPSCSEYISIIYCNRAAAYIALQQYSRAIEDCNSAIRRNPLLERAYTRKAKAEGLSGKLLESMKSWERICQLFPLNSSYRTDFLNAKMKYIQYNYSM